jgi:two-component system NarL family response regulator
MIQVLCVDDHALVREGIDFIVNREPDMELIGSVATGEEAIEFFRHHQPDITLMDLQLATIDGADAIRAIRLAHPGARVIVLTMYESEEHIHRAMSAGAATYLLKDTLAADLVRVIRSVYHGERSLPADVKAALETRATHPALTAREIQIMQLVSEGLRNKEIAAALSISEVTVITHLRNIYTKMAVNDRTAALSLAIRRGIIQIR